MSLLQFKFTVHHFICLKTQIDEPNLYVKLALDPTYSSFIVNDLGFVSGWRLYSFTNLNVCLACFTQGSVRSKRPLKKCIPQPCFVFTKINYEEWMVNKTAHVSKNSQNIVLFTIHTLFIPHVDTSMNECLQSYTIHTERHMKPTLFVVRGIRDERETLIYSYLMFMSHLICQNSWTYDYIERHALHEETGVWKRAQFLVIGYKYLGEYTNLPWIGLA